MPNEAAHHENYNKGVEVYHLPVETETHRSKKNRSVSKPTSKPQPFPQHEKAKLQTFIRLYQDGNNLQKLNQVGDWINEP